MIRIYKRLLVTVGALSMLVIAASAFASASRDSIVSIRAVERLAHPQRSVDVLDAATIAETRALDGAAQIGTHLLDQARALGTLPTGGRVYLIPTSKDRLCVLAARLAESCGFQLSPTAPVTFTVVDRDGPGGRPPLAYGAAADGVITVDVVVGGRRESAKVRANLYSFFGRASDSVVDFSTITAHFTDGSSVTTD